MQGYPLKKRKLEIYQTRVQYVLVNRQYGFKIPSRENWNPHEAPILHQAQESKSSQVSPEALLDEAHQALLDAATDTTESYSG